MKDCQQCFYSEYLFNSSQTCYHFNRRVLFVVFWGRAAVEWSGKCEGDYFDQFSLSSSSLMLGSSRIKEKKKKLLCCEEFHKWKKRKSPKWREHIRYSSVMGRGWQCAALVWDEQLSSDLLRKCDEEKISAGIHFPLHSRSRKSSSHFGRKRRSSLDSPAMVRLEKWQIYGGFSIKKSHFSFFRRLARGAREREWKFLRLFLWSFSARLKRVWGSAEKRRRERERECENARRRVSWRKHNLCSFGTSSTPVALRQ